MVAAAGCGLARAVDFGGFADFVAAADFGDLAMAGKRIDENYFRQLYCRSRALAGVYLPEEPGTMIASISTCAPRGNDATPIAARAG